MAISWLGKTAAIRQYVAAVQAAANAPVDASKGSLTLAFGQAVTGAFLWLQAFVIQVLMLTRAATSKGTDLDSWMADWFFTRLPANQATGLETFSRATPTLQAVVPIGNLVSTGPGGQQFIVTTDTTNAAYNSGLGGYVLPPNTASVTVPVAAVTPGAAGNVLANTVTSFVQPIPGIDSCTNAAPFTSGADAESDASFRARFRDYIGSFREGTVSAIRAAVLAIQQGITCQILENVDTDGTPDNGFLTIIVDDGSGNPSPDLINGAGSTVDLVRGAGIRFAVIGPTAVPAVISMTVVSADTSKHAADVTAATAAITNYVNTLPIGTKLVWSRLYQVAFDSSSNIVGVNSILLNGGTSDLAVTATQVVKTSSVTVT